ncbi:MAG: hypothetical protein ACQEQN_10850 [Thermodesulfobacteriota bacterium]
MSNTQEAAGKNGSNARRMNTYQKEQLQALEMVRQHMGLLEKGPGISGFDLNARMEDYLDFRQDVGSFFRRWFEQTCSENCYSSRRSACCSREGIIVFWADVVVNANWSDSHELDRLEKAIRKPEKAYKCIFLTESGCVWRIKPIICEMFLCSEAEKSVFGENPKARKGWRELEERKKAFTWPDRLVLFEALEKIYMAAGCDSPLMYMHKSPGLLRLIRQRKPNPPPI